MRVGADDPGMQVPRIARCSFPLATSIMDALNPAVVDITSKSLSVDCVAAAPQLGLVEPDEKFQGPLTIHLELLKAEGPITVTGTLECTAVRQCVRCLTEYADPLFVSVYAEFMRQSGTAPKAPAAELRQKGSRRREQPGEVTEEADEEEDEVYLYQGDHLDLVPMLREQVILAAPMQPLCREDCQGLCPQCGQNWNDRRCACPPEEGPSPFRVLRELQGKPSKGGNA